MDESVYFMSQSFVGVVSRAQGSFCTGRPISQCSWQLEGLHQDDPSRRLLVQRAAAAALLLGQSSARQRIDSHLVVDTQPPYKMRMQNHMIVQSA